MASGGVAWGTCRKQAFASFLEDSCSPVERSARAGGLGQCWLRAPGALEAWESPSPKSTLSASHPHCQSGFYPVLFWPLLEPELHLGQKLGQEELSQRKGLRQGRVLPPPNPGTGWGWQQLCASLPAAAILSPASNPTGAMGLRRFPCGAWSSSRSRSLCPAPFSPSAGFPEAFCLGSPL